MLRSLVAAVLLIASLTVAADEAAPKPPPSAEAMIYDAFFMRPLTLVGTAIGAGLFVVTLPISAVTGNVGDAAESFVAQPARSAFKRCLGCTSTADTPSGM